MSLSRPVRDAGASPCPPSAHAIDATRRGLLIAGAAAIAASLTPRAAAAAGADPGPSAAAGQPPAAPPDAFARPLPLPPELTGQPDRHGVRHYALRMQQGRSELVAGVSTPTWGYNGSYLGPVLRVPRGRPVSITVANGLDQASTTHWHGAHAPGPMDGGPHAPTLPGGVQRSAFTLDQPAATLWYHPHPHMRTGAQVWAGLAGLLLVDDGVDARLGLPRTWGVDDIPLVLQDRRIGPDGVLLYMPRGARDMMGMKGDRFLVNGVERPFVSLPAQPVRLRLLNGSNARLLNLAFADRRPFHVVASDAGLLPRPVPMDSLLLSPGERAEIVVDLGGLTGQALVLRSDSGAVVPALAGASGDTDDFDQNGFDLLQIRVTAPTGQPGRLPPTLVDIDTLHPKDPAPRIFTLQNMVDDAGSATAGMPGMRGMAAAEPDAARGPGGMSMGIGGVDAFSINHEFMNMGVVNQQVRLGATEVWEVSNAGGMPHPFHVHGTSFQVLSRNGAAPPEHERGWKDVVLLRRNETVRLVMRFDRRAGADHPFMYHCHILEHEDNGMMGQFTVT